MYDHWAQEIIETFIKKMFVFKCAYGFAVRLAAQMALFPRTRKISVFGFSNYGTNINSFLI